MTFSPFQTILAAQAEAIILLFASTIYLIFRNPYSGDWYDFDDSSVTKISKKSVVSESAYILFYKRK